MQHPLATDGDVEMCKRQSTYLVKGIPRALVEIRLFPRDSLLQMLATPQTPLLEFPPKMQPTRFRRLTSARYEPSTLAKVDLLGVDTWLKECRLASIPWVAWKGWSRGLIVITLTVRFSLTEMSSRQQRRTNGSLVESG